MVLPMLWSNLPDDKTQDVRCGITGIHHQASGNSAENLWNCSIFSEPSMGTILLTYPHRSIVVSFPPPYSRDWSPLPPSLFF